MRSATVLGAGVFGAWIAHALRRRGWKVTLIDQHGPANARASSGGETRIIRSAYGSLAIYARWARESLPAWLLLQQRLQQQLFVPTGALFVGNDRRWLEDTAATLDREAIPCERLDPAQLQRRYPSLDFSDAAGAVFEPEAGVLFARRAVQALVRTLVEDGATFVSERVRADVLIRDSGADAIVFAAGPWLPQLFPAALRDVIFPTRQEVFFFGAPPGEALFDPPHLPAWVAFEDGVYGLPNLDGRGVKVAIDAHGPAADPERMERLVDPASLARIRDVLRRRLPALADAPLLETRVCQYENTSNGHFVLDRLPGHDRVWIAGGGSGHGFKHGPKIGEYVADLVEDRIEAEPVFALTGRPARQRAVY